MTINYSNETGINLPMAIWLLNDTYDHVDKENYISATHLLKPIREIVLLKQNKKEDKAIEISTLIKSRLGTALHDSIETAWLNKNAIAKACKLVGIAEDMATDINAANINNITASFDVSGNLILVHSQGTAFTIVNGTADANGNDFAGNGSVASLGTSYSAASGATLKLTRTDGGEIILFDKV